MEIIFDKNLNDSFQGTNYPVYKLNTPDVIDFPKIQNEVRNLVNNNLNNPTILIRPEKENAYFYMFVAILSIQNKSTNPTQAVFKVLDYKKSANLYRPYFSFASAADYILRLLGMKNDAMYKDIQTLSYLGLDVNTNYTQNTISLHLPNNGKKYNFKASSVENSTILASFVKMLALMKHETTLDVTITLKMLPETCTILINRDRLLRKLYWCAKPFFNNPLQQQDNI